MWFIEFINSDPFGPLIAGILLVCLLIAGFYGLQGSRENARKKAERRANWLWSQRYQAEVARRAELRKKWLFEQRPALFYNTMDGITAVLTPKKYEEARQETRRRITDGGWASQSSLYPSHSTFIFLTQKGRPRFAKSWATFLG